MNLYNKIATAVFSALCLIGAAVCAICDLAICKALTWSPIAIASIALGWLILCPITTFGKSGMSRSLSVLSLIILPYLYLLSIFTKESTIFTIGAVMSILTIIYLWCVFVLFRRSKTKLKAAGIALLLCIPLHIIITVALNKLIAEPIADLWDILTALMILILAVTFFILDYKIKTQKAVQK